MEKESWNQIRGYEGDYLISNYGRVYSEKRKIFLKTVINKRGYENVCLCICGKQKTFSIHQLVGRNFLYKPDWADQINHIDGNKLNNHLSNLEWTDGKGNINHAHKMGLVHFDKRGIRNSQSKLSEDEVREIIRLRTLKIKGKVIAERFGITPGHVYKIANGIRWSHFVV